MKEKEKLMNIESLQFEIKWRENAVRELGSIQSALATLGKFYPNSLGTSINRLNDEIKELKEKLMKMMK